MKNVEDNIVLITGIKNGNCIILHLLINEIYSIKRRFLLFKYKYL